MNCKYLFSKNYSSVILLVGMFLLSTSPALFAQHVNPPTAPKIVQEAVESEGAETKVATTDPGMQIAVDGSSLEAFEESLAEIKESATEANYTTVENAIQWLLVYDLGAGRDKAKLAKNLDGMTGDEIVGQVEWRKKR